MFVALMPRYDFESAKIDIFLKKHPKKRHRIIEKNRENARTAGIRLSAKFLHVQRG
ncbi:MAG: hypothetical protein K2L78_04060 [Muribaculaceae bacterium]|nr:hypothetical protein [Muribaculaceae bacterium]